MRGPFAVAVTLALMLPGCLDAGGSGFEELVVRVTNQGGSTIPADVTVTSPSGAVLLEETVQVPGQGSVERTVDATEAGTYSVFVHYEKRSTQGSNTQYVEGSQRHTLRHTDCETDVVVVEFVVDYTSSSTSQSFSNKGSFGTCIEAT